MILKATSTIPSLSKQEKLKPGW